MGLKDNFKQAVKELTEVPGGNDPAKPVAAPKPAKAPDPKPAEKTVIPTTVIAAGTVIQGPVNAAGDLELWGELRGDVESRGGLKLCGRLMGRAVGASVSLCGAQVQGDVNAKGTVYVDEASVIIGSFTADSLVVNGRIKGDITVKENLSLEDKAVVCGNISAKKLVMAEGAVLQGEVKITADMEQAFRKQEEKKG